MSTSAFPPTSRYYMIETATLDTTGERIKRIIYLRRRFLPSPTRFELLQEHLVTEHERLDNITATYVGDPEQFWRICDANGAMRPEELTESVGRWLRITLPADIPGVPNA
jgi:hypothetical protein